MDRHNLAHLVRNRVMVARHMVRELDHELTEMEEQLKKDIVKLPGYIMIHHSLTQDGRTVSWDAIRRYHVETLGWRNIGYHYGIELIGDRYEVLTGRMVPETGAHCREHHMNHHSVGVCFMGNFDLIAPPQEQWDLGVALVKSLMLLLEIPAICVCGHREYAPYKSCPGAQFNLEAFRRAL